MIKKIGLIAVFLLAACLSFIITRQIKLSIGEVVVVINDTTNVVDCDTTVAVDRDTTVAVDDTTNIDSTNNHPLPISLSVVLKASKPVEDDNRYSFKASFVGEPTESFHFELWNNKLVAKSENGSFVNIPAINGGKYKLCLVGNESGKNLASPIIVKGFIDISSPNPPVKKLISEEDFQMRMLAKGDYTLNGGKVRGKKSFVTNDFRVVVVNGNSDDGDFVVSDIQDVRDMIYTYNKWKSARVVELEYDSKGYVTLAKVSPVY